MFFTHKMQYSLLLLIHVQVQCYLAITRFTCDNLCLLNCLNLFLKYKIGWACFVCVCVCVCFGIKMLIFLLRDDFESLKCCLDPWLSCMLDCIHIYVFPFLKNYFKATLTDPQHLSTPGLSVELFSWFLSQSQHLSIARWINRESFCPLNRSSTNPRSIELLFALDTCLTDASIEPFKAQQILNISWSVEIYWWAI